jgi:glycerol-3-phosphate dehydrogenase
MKRAEALDRVREDPAFDVVILGAGINGCGTFRHLCLSGLRCLLVDRADISSGTSAGSSRMAHGGLRYLETGNIALVRESLRERNFLFRNAPHRVRPTEVIIPYRRRLSGLGAALLRLFGLPARPAERGGLLIRTGLLAYDFFGAGRGLPRSTRLTRRALDRKMPGLDPTIIGAGVYTDGRIDNPERLALELVLDGLRVSPGSVALTYAEVRADGDGLILRPRLDEAPLPITARVIVNAGGPHIDQINAGLGLDTSHVTGSQGTHLILDYQPLARSLGDRILYFETRDGRLCLAYRVGDKVFAGTTDRLTSEPDGEPDFRTESAYILSTLASAFPDAAPELENVVSSTFGVRAFAAVKGEDAGSIPRDHSLALDRARSGPVISLIGGKWTTFRAFAADAATEVLRQLSLPPPLDTAGLPIGGGAGWPAVRRERVACLEALGLSREVAERVADRYGNDARIDHYLAQPNDRRSILGDGALLAGELRMFCEDEMVITLADVVFRRSGVGLWETLTQDDLISIAQIVGPLLGWTEEQMRFELRECSSQLRTRRLPLQ